MSGDTAFISAHYADAQVGAVYVFERTGSGWVHSQKLVAADVAPDDRFGMAVSARGDVAVVGSPRIDNGQGINAGAAHVFVRSGSGWAEQQKLVASDTNSSHRFGRAVSLSGDVAIIGAPKHDHGIYLDAGAMYAFVRSGPSWAEQQMLVASDEQGIASSAGSVWKASAAMMLARLAATPARCQATKARVWWRPRAGPSPPALPMCAVSPGFA